MAQPKVTTEQVQHLLTGATAHIDSHNWPRGQQQMLEALVQAVLLLCQEADQIGDCLAVIAGLKTKAEVEIT